VTGRVEVIERIATWAKVNVTPRDGSENTVGWVEDVSTPPGREVYGLVHGAESHIEARLIDAETANSGTIADLLGGSQILGRVINTELDAHEMLHEGLPRAALSSLVDKLHVIEVGEASAALGVSVRTLQRHKSDPDALLDVQQSGRAWTFAEILAKATRLLGSQDEAEQWLRRPAIGLDQRRPLDLLTTPAGVTLVEDYLGRLEYDVYT
jgi:putative toxin-antitoxin system antitoxin component (TIGR02293 family)